MKISIQPLIPKDWNTKNFGNKISVTYETNYRYKPHSVIFPKIIDVNENFVEAIALYLGDGSFQKNKFHTTFTNKDRDVCKFMWDFFRERFGITVKDITCEIRYRKEKPVLSDWSKVLNIPEEKLKLKYYIRNRDKTFHLQINRTIFRQIFERITKKFVYTNFIKNEKYRRAFLRGLFAAEGHIGLAKDSPKPYINYMSYHLSVSEDKLARSITSALSLEGIYHKIIKHELSHSIEIRIIGWDNYWKLWRARTFDICERKKHRFYNVARNLTVNCTLNKSFRGEIFSKTGLTQKELARHLNSWQGNVCKIINGDLSISVDRLITLSKLSGISLMQIKKNITNVVVGALTPINDYDFIDFIFNLKSSPTNPYF